MVSEPPIQNLDTIDIIGKRRDGGVDLTIVVSSDLDDTEAHRDLLGEKLNTYLAAIADEGFQAELGHPEQVRIEILCHGELAPGIAAWLDSIAPVVREHGAELVVVRRGRAE